MGKFGYLDSIILKAKEVMKEVKEVVHVPTRELAEEVLRVGAENCLMEMIDIIDWEYYKTETYFRPNGFGGYGKLSLAKIKGDKIITAEEFLNRYKPKFRPIAMRCTQEQFEAVKDKLVGCDFGLLADFENFEYLSNNVNGFELLVSNINYSRKECNNRQVFEEWNEKTFLEYCGISIGVEDSHKDIHVKGCFNTDKYELDKLRKENESLKKHYNNVEQELKHLNNELSKELGLVKKQLKEIQDQPKVGDVCLFWDDYTGMYIISKLNENGGVEGVGKYDHCIKATPENIQAKINELKNK